MKMGKRTPTQRATFRGFEVVEASCHLAPAMMGETLDNLARGVDTYSFRQPLGVCAGICPFNFPVMIPLWMIPIALTTGNTYVVKPSEKTPGGTMIIARLLQEAGLPDGVFNVIHGSHDPVNFICDNPEIKAISFVGANPRESIHDRATKLGKRTSKHGRQEPCYGAPGRGQGRGSRRNRQGVHGRRRAALHGSLDGYICR